MDWELGAYQRNHGSIEEKNINYQMSSADTDSDQELVELQKLSSIP